MQLLICHVIQLLNHQKHRLATKHLNQLSESPQEREFVQTTWVCRATYLTLQSDPNSFEEATSCPKSSEWIKAMESEMKSLTESDVWDIVPLPSEKKCVGSQWVYKVKKGADGSVE